MMRCAERAGAADPPAFECSRDRLDHRDLQRLRRIERRQDARQARGEHALPCTRRPVHQQIVTTRRCNLQSALGGFLTLHALEIGARRGFIDFTGLRFGQVRSAFEMVEQADQVGCSADWHTARPARLGPLRCRTDQPRLFLACMQRCQQYARRSDHAAIERQLAHRNPVAQLLGIGHAHCREQRQRNRQVVVRAFLGQIGGREVDRDPLWRQRQAHRGKRSAYPFLAFANSLVGQPDDVEFGQTRSERALHLHATRLQAEISDRPDQCDHAHYPLLRANVVRPRTGPHRETVWRETGALSTPERPCLVTQSKP